MNQDYVEFQRKALKSIIASLEDGSLMAQDLDQDTVKRLIEIIDNPLPKYPGVMLKRGVATLLSKNPKLFQEKALLHWSDVFCLVENNDRAIENKIQELLTNHGVNYTLADGNVKFEIALISLEIIQKKIN